MSLLQEAFEPTCQKCLVLQKPCLPPRAFTTLCYSADGQNILAGGMSKFVCLYHVQEQILVKRFELSCNLSLDAMEVSSGAGLLGGALAPQALSGPRCQPVDCGYGKTGRYTSLTVQKSPPPGAPHLPCFWD